MTSAHPLRRAIAVLGVALATMVLNVGASVLWVLFYSLVIEPGHDDAFYAAYAQVAAPWSSIIAGFPLMFLAARWLSRRAGRRDAILVAVAYITIDALILLAAGAPARLLPIVVASFGTKLLAAWLGAGSGHARRAAAQPAARAC